MAYTSYNRVVNRYPVLKTWGQGKTEVNSDLIYYAEFELNGLLAPAFTVPFEAGHPTVEDLAIDLAYYRAFRTKNAKQAEMLHKVVIGRIDKIIAGDEYIQTGSGTTIKPDSKTDRIWSSTEKYHPTHGMLDAEDSEISSSQLSDEFDERY